MDSNDHLTTREWIYFDLLIFIIWRSFANRANGIPFRVPGKLWRGLNFGSRLCSEEVFLRQFMLILRIVLKWVRTAQPLFHGSKRLIVHPVLVEAVNFVCAKRHVSRWSLPFSERFYWRLSSKLVHEISVQTYFLEYNHLNFLWMNKQFFPRNRSQVTFRFF